MTGACEFLDELRLRTVTPDSTCWHKCSKKHITQETPALKGVQRQSLADYAHEHDPDCPEWLIADCSGKRPVRHQSKHVVLDESRLQLLKAKCVQGMISGVEYERLVEQELKANLLDEEIKSAQALSSRRELDSAVQALRHMGFA